MLLFWGLFVFFFFVCVISQVLLKFHDQNEKEKGDVKTDPELENNFCPVLCFSARYFGLNGVHDLTSFINLCVSVSWFQGVPRLVHHAPWDSLQFSP